MIDGEIDLARTQGTKGPMQVAPDVMLDLWSSWMNAHSGLIQDWVRAGKLWWQVTPDGPLSETLANGAKQLNEILAKDPLLRSIDMSWNGNPLREVIPVDWAGIARSLRTVWLLSLARPGLAAATTAELSNDMVHGAMEAWNDASREWFALAGRGSQTALGRAQKQAPSKVDDKRFSAPEWQTNPVYRTMRDIYLLASDWLLRQGGALEMDPAEHQRVNFHLRQFVDAMSPCLLLISNPDALRRAMETGGASLAEGARNLLADLKEGRLSMVDAAAFAPGRNLALTPGEVVHRNKLIELIQYTPTTDAVHQTPLVIFPPWINKYYILDMQPKNSMVRWLTDQGFTVFIVSWKNPDTSMDGITIEDYIDLGPLEAINVVREITGQTRINTMGYCIGGTLQALTLAWLAAKDDNRISAATFMVSLQDFSAVGDTAVFLDEEGFDFVEQQMMERGYLDSRAMSNMFNLLRSNDLIWSNVVNNYLLGQKPPAFDLLYWNSDGTRMARAAHSWYLRNTYVENNLMTPGKVTVKGEPVDLGRIKLDVYAVGAEKDHIVPWDSAWRVTQLVGGRVHYVLASSGHIAGIINPPGGKGTYWTHDSERQPATAEAWLQAATRHNGSWWMDWKEWLAARSGEKVPPPQIGSAAHPPLEAAPGRYVLEK